MSKRQPRTFSEFFVSQNKKIPGPEVSPNFKRSTSEFIETPRELPGLAEMLEEEALRRRFKSFIRSHRGGSRTVAPAPAPIGKVGNFQVFQEPAANTELKPRVHAPRPEPVKLDAAQRTARADAREKAKAVALARTHAKVLREAADAAEARLLKMES